MSEELHKARRLLEAGDHKRAVETLWDVEVAARTDRDEAEGLLELSTQLQGLTSGKVQREAVLLLEYAQTYLGRLNAPPPTARRARIACTALGGYGWQLAAGAPYELDFDADGVTFFDVPAGTAVATVPYAELLEFEIGGPGEQTTGGGFMGGGFGLEGAAQGMLAAGVLNAITSRSKITTTFSLHAVDAEAFFLHGDFTPYELRIRLSEVFVRMRRARNEEAPLP